MKTSAQSRGDWGERQAQTYLEQKGFQFVTANWKCKAGEIDLIMKENNELVFIEVRLRRPTSFGAGLETVAWQKQRKLIRAAQWYLQSTRQYSMPARFDVVSIIYRDGQDPVIEHIEHAFAVN